MLNTCLKQVGKQLNLIKENHPDLDFYNQDAMYMIAYKILNKIYESYPELKLTISRADSNELLIYREYDNIFNNIIIDTDGDIEFNILSNDNGIKQHKIPFKLYMNNELSDDIYKEIIESFYLNYNGTNYYQTI